jgi:hypothetical protein
MPKFTVEKKVGAFKWDGFTFESFLVRHQNVSDLANPKMRAKWGNASAGRHLSLTGH